MSIPTYIIVTYVSLKMVEMYSGLSEKPIIICPRDIPPFNCASQAALPPASQQAFSATEEMHFKNVAQRVETYRCVGSAAGESVGV